MAYCHHYDTKLQAYIEVVCYSAIILVST